MNVWQYLIPEMLDFPQRMLALLAIPLLAGVYVLLVRRRNRKAMRFTNSSMIDLAMPRTSQWRRHLVVATALLSLITLTVAWAKPVGLDRVRVERATVVVVLDVSQSMAATDVEPSRIAAAKAAAEGFVAAMPEGYNVSLVTLSGGPAVVVPPTRNRNAVTSAIERLDLRDGTAIGEALVVAMNALQQAPPGDNGEPAPGAIVLLSDGGTNTGRPGVQGAADAANAQVPVYTIAYGTENGYVDLDGERQVAPLDRDELQQVADRTGGKMMVADSADDLGDVYSELSTEVGYEPTRRDVTDRFAMFAGVFALLAALATISLSARWPS